MFTNPAITEALATEHRRDLIAQADASRLARTARAGNPTRPGPFWVVRRPANLARRIVTATAAVFAAAGLLMASPAATHGSLPQRASATHHFSAHVFRRWA